MAEIVSPMCIAIVGLFGRRAHWTVVRSVSDARLDLFDSNRMRALRRGDCTVGKATKRTALSVTCVVVIERRH
jgi:hypothetical protein